MKVLDERRRLFGLVNPVDLVAILLVLAVIAGMTFVLMGRNPGRALGPTAQSSIEVVALATVRDLGEAQYRIGEKVGRLNGSTIGTLKEAKVTPALVETFDSTGRPLLIESTVEKQIVFTIAGTGTLGEQGAIIGDERLRQNQTLDIQTPRFQAQVKILDIRIAD